MVALGLTLLAPSVARAQTVRICAIQGPGAIAPMLGARVSASGVITGDFQTSLGGFFMQEPGCDGDPATSDGIFVSTAGRPVTVTVGNRVTATGRVADAGLTTLVLESLSDNGPYAGSVEAVRLSPPADAVASAAYLETYEGMLVSLAPARVVSATDHTGQSFLMPDSSGVTRLYRGDTDGRKLGLAAPGGWLMLSQGDRVSDVTGLLREVSGQFEVDVPPSRSLTVERSGAVPPDAGGASSASLTVATLNLRSFFDTSDDPGKDDEVSSPSDFAAGLDRRANSIARYMGSPDVIGVQEAEKIEVLQDLAAQPSLIATGYRPVLVEGTDSRGLDVGLLYNSGRLGLRSVEARPACSAARPPSGPAVACPLSGGGSGFQLFTRPPLVTRLEALDNRERLTVVVNHFLDPSGDPAADDAFRVAQADAVRALVDELKAAEPDVPVIVLGDLNAVEDSAPLQHLTSGGRLVNPVTRSGERTYTHATRGLCEVVDHVLVDAALVPRVTEAKALHVNVDFGDAGPGTPPQASPRASDHDPVRLVLARR
jgi:predicted extracellular nuclease